MKQIPECFETTPIVYAVGNQYQIMVPVLAETLMWAEVDGKCYYDDVNGIMRSNCTTHRMTVPMDELNRAGKYTVCYRIVQERKPYFSKVEDVLHKQSKDYDLLFPYDAQARLNDLYRDYTVLSTEYEADGTHVRARLDEKGRGMFEKYILK